VGNLREGPDWHRLAVERAAVGILQLGPDGTLWQVNPSFCRILGVPAEELLGRALAERIHPEDLEPWRSSLARAAAGDADTQTVELRGLRKDGAAVWLEASLTAARDAAGRMSFSVGVVQDISARRDAERALRRRVANFFAAFDAAQVPMTQSDPATGRFERANPPFCELIGFTDGELLEMTMEQLTLPEDREPDADMASGFTPEKRYLRKDGSVLSAIRYASPMYHDSGELFRTLSAWVDVSARRRTEEALRLSEARFRTLAEAGPFMVYSSDAEGLPSYLSPTLGAYLGLGVEQVRNEDVLRSIVHPEDFAHVAALRAPASEVATAELRLRRADGAFRWFLARAVGLTDDAGRFAQRIGSLTDIHDRKQAELALGRSEERFRIASEAVDGLIYDLDLTTGHVYRSAGLTATLGWSLDEIPPTAEAWAALIHPDDREATLERSAAAMKAGLESFALEYRARHKAGHWIDLWDNQRILRDAKGEPLRVVGHSIDVTPRKRAEEGLRASEARLAALANASPALFWSTTVDGTNSWASEAWLRYTGQPVAEPGQWPNLLHPLDVERSFSAWQRALAEESHFVIENRIRRYDGEYRWFLTRAVPLRDEDGSVTGWMGASTDIHDLKLAEGTLRESEERFRILADGAPVLIWVNDREGCEFVNRAYREFLGVGDVDVRGSDWVRFVHPDDREAYLGAYARALEQQAPFQREFRFRRHDGVYRWMLSTGSPRRSASGELIGYVGSTFDITQHKQAEAALREDDRRKDEFLATLAHELRNPLAPIRNAVELLRLEPNESPQLGWARDMIDRQVDQLTRLVDDLLEVSRITRGALSLQAETVAVSQLFRDVAEASRPSLTQHGHELDVRLPEDELFLRADPVRLAQVLVNLLDNAAKHSGSSGRIRLSAEREGRRACLAVEDGGRGMTPEEQARVFEMFYRAGEGARHRPGLGVGLALVKSLVELHGGTVEAYSAGLGHGSRFTVYLPLLEADRPLAASAPAPEPTQAGRLRVLVVDDNPDSTESLAALLKTLGHEVETAADGIEACEVGERFRPDVILLDLRMPRLDGYGAARRIRGAPWGAGVVLVAQTGWGRESDRRRAEEAGFDFHLTKPVNFDALRRILDDAQPAPHA
jgi:PAS domain S-box-containing protein